MVVLFTVGTVVVFICFATRRPDQLIMMHSLLGSVLINSLHDTDANATLINARYQKRRVEFAYRKRQLCLPNHPVTNQKNIQPIYTLSKIGNIYIYKIEIA